MSNLRRIRDLPLKGTPELDDALEISADPSGSFHIITSSLSALFQLISEKGAANGYAALDASTKLLVSNLPDTVVQTDQANTYSAAVTQNFGTSDIINVGALAIGTATIPGAVELLIENTAGTANFRMIGSGGSVEQFMGIEFDWTYTRDAGSAIIDFRAISANGTGAGQFRFGIASGSTGNNSIILFEPGTPGTGEQTRISSSGAATFFNAIGGNVGIGDTTPSFKLDVAGIIRATDEFVLTDLSTDNSYVIKTSNITTDRDVTLPLLGADDTFVFEEFTQTLTNKTIVANNNSITIASTNLTDSSSLARNSNNLSFFSSTTSAQLLGVMSDETGSGLLVFGSSPVIVTPTIASFTNATHNHQGGTGGGQLLSTSALSDTANIAYLNTANTYTAGFKQSFVASSGTAGININSQTPSSTVGGDIWRATDALTYRNNADSADIVIATTSGTLAQFAATTSAELAGVITNETGSGSLVFASSPALVTPALGTPTAINLTNGTALPVSGLADGTAGQLITWNSSGVVTVVSTGTANQILTSAGTGNPPSFQDAAGAEFVGPWTEDHDAGTKNLKRLAAILDANDNEIMTFTNSVTPANFVTVASSDSGVAPTWSVDGDDANIDLDIAAKNSGVVNMVSPLSLEDNQINNLQDPTFDQDAVTKNYDDSANGFKGTVIAKMASTVNIDLSGGDPGDTIDGVTLVTNDRVLLKDQGIVNLINLDSAGVYDTADTVTVVFDNQNTGGGSGATATVSVNVGTGALETLTLQTPGSGYKFPPVIIFVPGLAFTTEATATATINSDQNGLYDAVDIDDTSTWIRTDDANVIAEVNGLTVFVAEGTASANLTFIQTETTTTLFAPPSAIVGDPVLFFKKEFFPLQSSGIFANADGFDQSIGTGSNQVTIRGLTSTRLPNRPGRFAMVSVVINASASTNGTDMFYAVAEDGTVGNFTSGVFYDSMSDVTPGAFSQMVEMTGQILTVVADTSKAIDDPTTLTVITDNTSNFQSKLQVTELG